MAIFKKSYKNYDKETKGIWQKIKIPLLTALAVILFIIVLSLGLTDAGLFPGNIIHRFTVNSYLEDVYSDSDYEIVKYDRYDPGTDYFIYKCRINGLDCEMKAKNFRVQFDGYYDSYCRNTYFQGITQDYMNNFLNSKWESQYTDYTASWESNIDISLSNQNYHSSALTASPEESLILDACKTYGGSFKFTLNIHGNNISFEDYKNLVWRAVRILQQEMDRRPSSLQVFYYRKGDSTQEVMQYESYITTYQFDYSENGILTAENVHKYVEVPEDLQKKADIYYTVKNIFITVVGITIVVLSVLWGVRKYRKHRQYKNFKSENSRSVGE